jgi:hypothetical protein
MAKITLATLKVTRLVNSEMCTMDCQVHSACAHLTSSSGSLTFMYDGGEMMTIEPTCYHNRSIMEHRIKGGDSLPPCAASAKANSDDILWRQTGRNKRGATYNTGVDLSK